MAVEMLAPLRWRNRFTTNPKRNGYSQEKPIPLGVDGQERIVAMGKVVARLENDLESNYLTMYNDQLKHGIITKERHQELVSKIGEVAKLRPSGVIYQAPMSSKIIFQEQVSNYA